MSRAARVVIAFILTLAIPLQGIAAATMAVCGPAAVHTSIEQGSPEAHAMHHHVHSSSHGKSDADPHSQHSGHDKLAKAKCSVCASCCTSAAMPATFVAFDSIALTESFAPTVPTGTPAFLTAGLERPPRIFVA